MNEISLKGHRIMVNEHLQEKKDILMLSLSVLLKFLSYAYITLAV